LDKRRVKEKKRNFGDLNKRLETAMNVLKVSTGKCLEEKKEKGGSCAKKEQKFWNVKKLPGPVYTLEPSL